MATATTVKKPTAAPLAKGAAKPGAPLAKPAGKPAAAKPAAKPAAEKVAKPPKEVKPFADGEIVIFKAYAKTPENPQFTEGEELAVVSQRDAEGVLMVACVKSSQYHKYKADENSVNGEELTVSEFKRTNKVVPAPYAMVPVSDLAKRLQGKDPLEVATELYDTAQQSFFLLGGVLNKLYREIDEDTGLPLFCGYQNADGKNYENSKDAFEQFLIDNFGVGGGSGDFALSSFRKAQYLMSIYDTFSNLKDAPKLIAEVAKIGWWKAALIAQYATDENASELVTKAGEQSSKQLEQTLKTEYVTEGTKPTGAAAPRVTIKRLTFTYKLYEDAGAGLEVIMKAAQKQLGLSDESAVFEHIVQAWASEHLGDAEGRADAATNRARVNLKKAGVKLPADHPAAEKPVQKAAA